jgi:ankyrin repeat protein
MVNKIITGLFALGAALLLTGCESPLNQAARTGNTGQIQQLLDQGADINADSRGYTPLMRAARSGNPKVVEQLLSKGADINAAGTLGNTALIVAATGGQIECVKALLDHGANLNQTNRHGKSALDYARKKGRSDIAQIIEAASRKGTAKEATPPSVPATLPPPAESAAPF